MSLFSGPSFSFIGAFFPSWMLYALVAILGTLVVRGVFIRVGIDDILPLRLTSYVAIAIAFASAIALAASQP